MSDLNYWFTEDAYSKYAKDNNITYEEAIKFFHLPHGSPFEKEDEIYGANFESISDDLVEGGSAVDNEKADLSLEKNVFMTDHFKEDEVRQNRILRSLWSKTEDANIKKEQKRLSDAVRSWTVSMKDLLGNSNEKAKVYDGEYNMNEIEFRQWKQEMDKIDPNWINNPLYAEQAALYHKIMGTSSFFNDVANPDSDVNKVTSITESADGSKKTVIEENKLNTPTHRAETQSTSESDPVDSQSSNVNLSNIINTGDEQGLNDYGLGSFGVDKDIGILDYEGWGKYDPIGTIESAAPTGSIENALLDQQGTLGLWDEEEIIPLDEYGFAPDDNSLEAQSARIKGTIAKREALEALEAQKAYDLKREKFIGTGGNDPKTGIEYDIAGNPKMIFDEDSQVLILNPSFISPTNKGLSNEQVMEAKDVIALNTLTPDLDIGGESRYINGKWTRVEEVNGEMVPIVDKGLLASEESSALLNPDAETIAQREAENIAAGKKALSDAQGNPHITTPADAIDLIQKEAPEFIPWVDEFAEYIKGVNEEEAIIAADRLMKKASETGLDKVKPRIFKALALALASMMFGADAVDAFNQGLEVVGKDYAAEAALVAAENKSLADLEDYTYKETLKSQLRMAEEGLKAPDELLKSNYSVMKDMVSHIQAMDEKLKESLGIGSAMGQIQRAADEIFKVYGVMNLKDPTIGGNFYQGIEEWLYSRTKDGGSNRVEPLESFIKDKIARSELTKYEGTIRPAHIIREDGYTELSKSENARQQRETVAELWSKVIAAAGLGKGGNIIGESSAVKLIMKDFKDYTEIHKVRAAKDADQARKKGLTPFVYFVTGAYVIDKSKLGNMYKEETKESLQEYLTR